MIQPSQQGFSMYSQQFIPMDKSYIPSSTLNTEINWNKNHDDSITNNHIIQLWEFFPRSKYKILQYLLNFFSIKDPKSKQSIIWYCLQRIWQDKFVSFNKHQMLKTQFFNSSLIWGSAHVHSPELIIQQWLNTDNSM